jgi:hypothetical protein
MPVSKKRKKDGKPVRRHGPASAEGEAHPEHPEGHPAHGPQRMGKPKNPFVAQKSQVRGAQRGR